MSYNSRIRRIESRIKKLEDSLKPKLKPINHTVFGDGGKIRLPDGKEVTASELNHLHMQGLYREHKIIQVRFGDANSHKHSSAIQSSTLKVESHNPLPESPTDTDTSKSNQTSIIIDNNPPKEPMLESSSPSNTIERKKRHSDTSPLVDLFK